MWLLVYWVTARSTQPMTEVLRALADSTRRRILSSLQAGPKAVTVDEVAVQPRAFTPLSHLNTWPARTHLSCYAGCLDGRTKWPARRTSGRSDYAGAPILTRPFVQFFLGLALRPPLYLKAHTQQFSKKEIQIVTAAFWTPPPLRTVCNAGLWDLHAINVTRTLVNDAQAFDVNLAPAGLRVCQSPAGQTHRSLPVRALPLSSPCAVDRSRCHSGIGRRPSGGPGQRRHA
jgi:hypothetical protein